MLPEELVNKIVMMARPSYPFIEQMKHLHFLEDLDNEDIYLVYFTFWENGQL